MKLSGLHQSLCYKLHWNNVPVYFYDNLKATTAANNCYRPGTYRHSTVKSLKFSQSIVSIAKTSLLIVLREIIAVYSENQRNTQIFSVGKNEKFKF